MVHVTNLTPGSGNPSRAYGQMTAGVVHVTNLTPESACNPTLREQAKTTGGGHRKGRAARFGYRHGVGAVGEREVEGAAQAVRDARARGGGGGARGGRRRHAAVVVIGGGGGGGECRHAPTSGGDGPSVGGFGRDGIQMGAASSSLCGGCRKPAVGRGRSGRRLPWHDVSVMNKVKL
jgi:hypothetical protein